MISASQLSSQVIIGRYDPEILLKTKPVRRRLSRLLTNNLKKRLTLIVGEVEIEANWDNFIIKPVSTGGFSGAQLSRIIPVVSDSFGVDKFFLASYVQITSADQLNKLFIDHFGSVVKSKTFGVRVRLRNNPWFASKRELESRLGGLIYSNAKGVDLNNPDVWVRVWIEGQKVWFINESYQGPAGFPLGSSSRALVLFSGGIDSPTAAWLAARKGLSVDFLLLTQAGDQQYEYVKRVLFPFYQRWIYPLRSYFYIFPGLPVSSLTTSAIKPRFRTLIFKRILYRIAYQVMANEGINVLVTGESLNQVSTQTPPNLAATQTYIPKDVVVIRPLITYTKVETVKLARRIGTLTASEQIPEYCLRSPSGSVVAAGYDQVIKQEEAVKTKIEAIVEQTGYQKLDLKKASAAYLSE